MKTTISLHGEAAEWVSALPKGRRGPYVMHLIHVEDAARAIGAVLDGTHPVQSGDPLLRVSIRVPDLGWRGVGGLSRFVQQLVESRRRTVDDALRLHKASKVVRAAMCAQFAVLGEERAFGRVL